MKPSSLGSGVAVVVALVALSVGFAPGCGDVSTNETGGGGGATTSTSEGGGSSSTTTTTEPSNPKCDELCSQLDAINCNVLQNCHTDCVNHLNAPEDCQGEADALIACWVEHIDEFTCTMQQVLPPAACSEAEKVFNTCVNGGGAPDTSCICGAGVGVTNETNCSRKTTCTAQDYTQVCQALEVGEPWTCSCFANGGLLGTCTEADAFEHCNNMYGCCVSLFCAASGE